MKLVTFSFIICLLPAILAQDIDDNDVPSECRSICANVVALTVNCDRQNDDDDSGYINCVCAGTNAATEIPACEACVANYDRNDGHDNDVNDLVRSCSSTTTAFNGAIGTSGTATATRTSNSALSTSRVNGDSQSRSTTSFTLATDTAGGFTIQTSTPTSTGTSGTSAGTVSTSPTATTNAGNIKVISSEAGYAGFIFLGALNLV